MKPLKKLNEAFNSGKKNNETSSINSTEILLPSISTMNREQSITMDQSSGVEQASVSPKDASAPDQRANVRRTQNVLLIWLDNNIDNNSIDCRNTTSQLRETVNDINMFTDGKECMQFIGSVTDTKVCMIISSSLAQQTVPHVHNMSQVDSIFIFCGDKDYNEQWAKDWPKIRGVFTERSSICEVLKKAAQQCEQSAISISFVATSGEDVSKKNLNQLDPIFMYSQILKEILLTIEFGDEHIRQYINYCGTVFSDNHVQLNTVDKLQLEYRMRTPIWWYTWESFLYPMLNYALRSTNMDIIIKMGFFINDLHRQIEKLHSEQFSGSNTSQIFILYRGQGMSNADFHKMTDIQGGLMSFNNFLSTSKDLEVSLAFARGALPNIHMVGILFVMTIDPLKSTIPFASIADVGCYGDREDEVLFSMHTVFRIDHITPMDENPRLFQVNLTLTSDNDQDLCVLTDRIREESYPEDKGWYRLGLLLLKMGESAKAQQVYETLLEQTTDRSQKARIFHMLGWTKYKQGEYNEAITFYEKALATKQQSIPSNHTELSMSFNNMGMVYFSMGDYPKALSYYEKALEIRKQSLPPNHPDLGMSFNNIGLVYYNMSDYPKALSSHEKALEIQKQSLPPNHPDLGTSYNNIGLVHYNTGDYPKALSSYERALEILKQSLPANHPDLGTSYNNIGLVYSNMVDYSKALSYYEKALEIQKQSLPTNHPDLGMSYNNIGLVYYNMRDYPKTLSYYEKDLEILKQSLSANHPRLGVSYSNIGLVYFNMSDYPKALSYFEKALEIQKQSLPSNHPHLVYSYKNIAYAYSNTRDYPKALLHHEKALEIQQQSLPPNDPNLGNSYNSIGWMYCKMDDYLKALSYVKKAVEIQEQSLPPNDPDLGNSYDTIGVVYCKLDDYSKALAFCEKAIAIVEQALPANNPVFCDFYTNIGEVYENMGDYSKAHSFYERAVKIGEQSLPGNHPDLEDYKRNLDRVKKKL